MPEQPTVSNGTDALRLAGSLILLVRALDQDVRAAAGDDPLSLAELGVLSTVSRGVEAPGMIARALRMDPARITHLTDKLVSHGYLERAVDLGDRRRWRLRLTDQGQVRLHAGRADTQTAMGCLLAGLTQQELRGLMDGLEGVRRQLAAPPPAP